MAVARWLRDSGLAQLAFETEFVGGRLRLALALLLSTRSPLAGRRARDGKEKDSKEPAAKNSMRVAILRGCVMEGLFSETNRATERVLSRNGCAIVEASGQMCCGALHVHAGQIESAKRLARKNIEAFLESGCDRVIVNAAGCGAAMKEYEALFADDARLAERAREFSAKVRDVSEFLVEIGIARPEHPINRRVAYDAPCHLMHAQRIAQAPIDVLAGDTRP